MISLSSPKYGTLKKSSITTTVLTSTLLCATCVSVAFWGCFKAIPASFSFIVCLKQIARDLVVTVVLGTYFNMFMFLVLSTGSSGSGSYPGGDASCTMTLDSDDFVSLFRGQLNPTQAFMGGKLKIKGDMMMAMKLEKLMGQMKSKL